MIQVGTILNVCDNSGIKKVTCIKILGSSKKRYAYIGDKIKVSSKIINSSKFNKGSIFNAIVLRTKYNYKRLDGFHIKFEDNSVVLLNDKNELISTRIFGPVIKELKNNKFLKNDISQFSNLII